MVHTDLGVLARATRRKKRLDGKEYRNNLD
jgi:hypothetical protein